MTFLYVLFIGEIFLFIFAYFASQQDIMDPAVIMSGMFIISTIAAFIWGKDFDIKYSFDACVILISGIATFVISDVLFRMVFQRKRKTLKKITYVSENSQNDLFRVPIQKGLLTIIILLDLVGIIWYIITTIKQYGGIGGIVRISQSNNTKVELSDVLSNPLQLLLIKISNVSGYIAAFIFCQNIVAKEKDKGLMIRLFFIMTLSQGSAVVHAARGEILRFIVAVLVYYYILWHQKNGWNRNLTWKYLRIGFMCIILGIPLFYYSLEWMGRKTGATLASHSLAYLGSSIWMFNEYIKHPTKPITWGEESLVGVHIILKRFLGIDTYIRNVNLEFRTVKPGYSTNVYTFFRRPLHDFGYIGMLIFTILVSLLFASIYYGKIKCKQRTKRVDYWSLIYGYLFYWIVISSILQYSELYITTGTIVNIIGMVIGYRILYKTKITFGVRKK